MKRSDLTEKLLDIKRAKGWTWKYICEEIGGMSPVLITGAVLGQMKMTKPQAAKAAELFGLTKSEEALLNEVPSRGSPMPPTDPLIYRFYELVMVNGPALKVLIEEEFGDGIMSAIDFDMRWSGSPIPRAIACGCRCPANSCHTSITARRATLRLTATRKSEEPCALGAHPGPRSNCQLGVRAAVNGQVRARDIGCSGPATKATSAATSSTLP